MKIAIISDTHGRVRENLKKILRESDYVIHAGDIGSQHAYQELKALNENICAVRGNCDRGLWAAMLPETLSFHLDGILFFVIHSRTSPAFQPEDAKIIVCGHTHRYAQQRFHNSILINPGSCTQPRDGTPSCVVITTNGGKLAQIERLDLSL